MPWDGKACPYCGAQAEECDLLAKGWFPQPEGGGSRLSPYSDVRTCRQCGVTWREVYVLAYAIAVEDSGNSWKERDEDPVAYFRPIAEAPVA